MSEMPPEGSGILRRFPVLTEIGRVLAITTREGLQSGQAWGEVARLVVATSRDSWE